METSLFGCKWMSWINTKDTYAGIFRPEMVNILSDSAEFYNRWFRGELCSGELLSEDVFGYGTYEWEIELPSGNEIWPAVWLVGVNSWPPEIDVFEGYSDNEYELVRFETNVHYGTKDNHLKIGARKVCSLWCRLFKTLRLKLVWTDKFIKIYYNGVRVRCVRRSDVLKWFNQPMRVVMNNGLTKDFGGDLRFQTPMVVKSFRYEPYD